MEIRARQKERIIVLDLLGRIDANSANLVEVVGQCLRDGYGDILCNFEEIEVIDYVGISAIVLAYKETANHKGRMKFANIPAHLKGLFSITGLDRVIDIYATEDLAINSFKEDKIIEDIKKIQLRRRFKRLHLDIKIEIKDKYDKNASCLKEELLNLSAQGGYIYGCDRFKLGDMIVLKMKLPPKGEELQLDAKVVWLSDKQIQPQIHPGMGVEFYDITNQMQQKLLEFIERNLSLASSED
ncbi:MAG: PilZ domain-containing protein [Candidatus Omnitrophica bacterium]|nr:PilZ domain-containing protein [Candidatus Omnitrophota bacterium]